MMKPESTVQAEIMLTIGALPGVRVFRNTVGEGWVGDVVANDGGAVVIRNARYVRFGLCPGSSDLIGWRSLLITPAMVGITVAQFLAPEVKTQKGVESDLQPKFINAVNAAGGCAGFVRSPVDAMKLVRAPPKH